MRYSNDFDPVGKIAIKHEVWESLHNRPSKAWIRVPRWEAARHLLDELQHLVHVRDEPLAEPCCLRLIPLRRGFELSTRVRRRLWASFRTQAFEYLRSNLMPRNWLHRTRVQLAYTPVEFGRPRGRPLWILRPLDAFQQLGCKRKPVVRRKLQRALQKFSMGRLRHVSSLA